MFSLVSNWLQPVEFPMRDPDIWGIDYRGYGLWGASSIGRTAYVFVPGAIFLERDLIDIVGTAGHEEWDAGLGTIAAEADRWKASILFGQHGAVVVPLKHPKIS